MGLKYPETMIAFFFMGSIVIVVNLLNGFAPLTYIKEDKLLKNKYLRNQ